MKAWAYKGLFPYYEGIRRCVFVSENILIRVSTLETIMATRKKTTMFMRIDD